MFFGGRTSWPQGLVWGGYVKICTTRSSTAFSWNCSRIRSPWGQWLPESQRFVSKMGWIDLQFRAESLCTASARIYTYCTFCFSVSNNMKQYLPAREVAWCDHVLQEIFELYIGKIRNKKSKKRALQESKAEVVPRQQTWSPTAPGRQLISLWMAETTRQMDVFRIPYLIDGKSQNPCGLVVTVIFFLSLHLILIYI